MAERKVLCNSCRKKFLKKDLIQVSSSKRVCGSCKQNSDDYKDLIDYVCKGFGQKAPTGKQLKEISKFKELGISYKEIKLTIYFIACVEKKPMENGSLFLVPSFHTKAMAHFKALENTKKSLSGISKGDDKEITIVRNKSFLRKLEKERVDKTRYIDISNLI